MECRRLNDQLDYTLTGDIFKPGYECTPSKGLICVNAEQPAGRTCDDYEVRFFCVQGKLTQHTFIFILKYPHMYRGVPRVRGRPYRLHKKDPFYM